MTKNEEAEALLKAILEISTLGEKNLLIGFLKGILWQIKKEQPDKTTRL